MKLFPQEQASSEAMLKAVGEPPGELEQNHKKKGVNVCLEDARTFGTFVGTLEEGALFPLN